MFSPDQDKQSGWQYLCEKITRERLPEKEFNDQSLVGIFIGLVHIRLQAVFHFNNRVEVQM